MFPAPKASSQPEFAENENPAHSEFSAAIPNELWERIMSMRLYKGTEFSAQLQWGDITGVDGNDKDEREQFRREMLRVSRSMRTIALRVLGRMLVISTREELNRVRDAIEEGQTNTRDNIGRCTKRLDVAIEGCYTPRTLGRLLKLLPCLEVFILRNKYEGGNPPIRFPPGLIIDTLGKWNPELKRIQFQSPNEEPTVRMVKQLIRDQPNLSTLHLDSVYWPAQGDDDNGKPITKPHQSLTTLSLGSIKRRYHTREGLDRAGVFLEACTAHDVFPNLRRLHLQKNIPSMGEFIAKYGRRLKELAYAGGDHGFGPDWGPAQGTIRANHITMFTPNINELIVIASDHPGEAQFEPLPKETSAEDVYVVQVHVDGESGVLGRTKEQALRLVGEDGFEALKRVWLVNTQDAQGDERGSVEKIEKLREWGVAVYDITQEVTGTWRAKHVY